MRSTRPSFQRTSACVADDIGERGAVAEHGLGMGARACAGVGQRKAHGHSGGGVRLDEEGVGALAAPWAR